MRILCILLICFFSLSSEDKKKSPAKQLPKTVEPSKLAEEEPSDKKEQLKDRFKEAMKRRETGRFGDKKF